jgi:RHS repeat-associated protein
VVTRGGDAPGTVYVHADNIGSVEKLTNEKGNVVEKRSYDPYGQRRNPAWGQPPPASFSSKTTLGFTGHESDDEVGLVNMRGRVFDPKVGRFLTTDPIVSDLYFEQSFNPYSYVLGNPLTLVDPSGFQPAAGVVSEPGFPDVALPYDEIKAGYGYHVARYLNNEGPPPKEPGESPSDAVEFGASAPPTDVDTTGISPEIDPQAATTAPEEGLESSTVVRAGLGFSYGVGQGWLPGGFLVPSAQPKDWVFEFWRGLQDPIGAALRCCIPVGVFGLFSLTRRACERSSTYTEEPTQRDDVLRRRIITMAGGIAAPRGASWGVRSVAGIAGHQGASFTMNISISPALVSEPPPKSIVPMNPPVNAISPAALVATLSGHSGPVVA